MTWTKWPSGRDYSHRPTQAMLTLRAARGLCPCSYVALAMAIAWVEPEGSHQVRRIRNLHKKAHVCEPLLCIWRRGRDSNPGYLSVRWFSRPVLSTAQPPLRRVRIMTICWPILKTAQPINLRNRWDNSTANARRLHTYAADRIRLANRVPPGLCSGLHRKQPRLPDGAPPLHRE